MICKKNLNFFHQSTLTLFTKQKITELLVTDIDITKISTDYLGMLYEVNF